VGRCVVAPRPHGLAQVADGLIDPTELGQGNAKPTVGLGKVGPQLHGLAETVGGFGGLALRLGGKGT
jgi:hypothetical protein